MNCLDKLIKSLPKSVWGRNNNKTKKNNNYIKL